MMPAMRMRIPPMEKRVRTPMMIKPTRWDPGSFRHTIGKIPKSRAMIPSGIRMMVRKEIRAIITPPIRLRIPPTKANVLAVSFDIVIHFYRFKD
jgi:hypothetical protein